TLADEELADQSSEADGWRTSRAQDRTATQSQRYFRNGVAKTSFKLALLWQIYSRRFSVPIHFRQCGHRFDGSRVMTATMVWGPRAPIPSRAGGDDLFSSP